MWSWDKYGFTFLFTLHPRGRSNYGGGREFCVEEGVQRNVGWSVRGRGNTRIRNGEYPHPFPSTLYLIPSYTKKSEVSYGGGYKNMEREGKEYECRGKLGWK